MGYTPYYIYTVDEGRVDKVICILWGKLSRTRLFKQGIS